MWEVHHLQEGDNNLQNLYGVKVKRYYATSRYDTYLIAATSIWYY
jgi:hypothetical protein